MGAGSQPLVERGRARGDAQRRAAAREIEIGLPHELTAEQRRWLVQDFVREQFVRKGYAVDVAIHAPDKGTRGIITRIFYRGRRLEADGFAPMKDPAMNKREQLGAWREQWAHLANRHLERHGHAGADRPSQLERAGDRPRGGCASGLCPA